MVVNKSSTLASPQPTNNNFQRSLDHGIVTIFGKIKISDELMS